MPKTIIARLLALAILAMSSSFASATFNISVSGNSGPSFTPYSSSTTSVPYYNLTGGSTTPGFNVLAFGYTINDNPSSGNYQISSLNFSNTSGGTVNLTVTISETNMTLPVGGTKLTGFASYTASGSGSDPNQTFSSVTTYSGTGNVASIPTTTFQAAVTDYKASTSFNNSTSPSTITTTFTLNLPNNESATFGSAYVNGYNYGLVGAAPPGVPVPPTALFGLFGVPTLALLRRIRNK